MQNDTYRDLPGGEVVKNPPAKAGDTGSKGTQQRRPNANAAKKYFFLIKKKKPHNITVHW